MHFATRVRTWRVARLYSVMYSEIALSRKPLGIGHVHIYMLRMTHTMTSQNIDLSSWDTLYIHTHHTLYIKTYLLIYIHTLNPYVLAYTIGIQNVVK
jgi:hypothetical protein